MAGSVSGLITFGTQSGPIEIGDLDTNFSALTTAVNSANSYSNYLVDSGSANTIAVTVASPASATLAAGLTLTVKVAQTNTGATTLNLNSGGAVAVVDPLGAPLAANDLNAGGIYTFIYNGSKWQISGALASGTTGVAYADTFTTTLGQTVFTLSNNPGNINNLGVSLDGATLVANIDYTWTSPTTLTLTAGTSLNQTLFVRYIENYTIGTPIAGGSNAQIQYNNGGSLSGFTMSGDVTVVPTTGVATVQNMNYTQGATGSVTRTTKAKLQESVSVADFGAVGDGVTNDTAAFNAAIAATNGEIILDPTKTYAVNLTITKRGIRINGRSGDNISVSGTPIKNLVPYSTSSPVITVGNDSGIVGGVVIENLSIWSTGPSGNGVIGLKLGGGAYGCTFRNLEIGTAFSQYNVLLQSGTNPVAYNQFQNIQLWTVANSSLTATLGLLYGSSYTTANYFNQINITGPSGTGTGFAVVVDSCIFSVTNCWIQAENNKGVEFNNNYSNFPYMLGTNVTIDSNYSTDVLVNSTVASDTSIMPVNFLRGWITVDGYYKNAAGTSTAIPYAGYVPYNTLINYPVFFGNTTQYNITTGNAVQISTVFGASNSTVFGDGTIAGYAMLSGGSAGVYLAMSGSSILQGTTSQWKPIADNTISNGAAANRWSTTYSGWMQLSTAVTSAAAGTVSIGGTTATTVGAAGGASALPATPLGYLIGYVGTTQVKIPYYNA